MLKADKSNLAYKIWRKVDQDLDLPESLINPTYVIDGGHLLFKMKWKKVQPLRKFSCHMKIMC